MPTGKKRTATAKKPKRAMAGHAHMQKRSSATGSKSRTGSSKPRRKISTSGAARSVARNARG